MFLKGKTCYGYDHFFVTNEFYKMRVKGMKHRKELDAPEKMRCEVKAPCVVRFAMKCEHFHCKALTLSVPALERGENSERKVDKAVS